MSSSYGRAEHYSDNPSSGGNVSGDFDRLTSSISSNIQKIAQNTSRCQRLVDQLGTPQDRGNLTSQIQDIQHNSNELSKTTNTLLKTLTDSLRNCPTSQKRQRELQKNRLAEEFGSILNKVQKIQREAADKEKASVARARAHSSSTSNPFAEADDYTGGAGYTGDLINYENEGKNQSMQAVLDEEENLAAIQERESAIKNLESDILDVNQIFKDLGAIVYEQGEMIDSIESNVETAAVHVEEGNVQLVKAAESQSAARKKKCICLVILVVAVVVIVLIIVLTTVLKNKKT